MVGSVKARHVQGINGSIDDGAVWVISRSECFPILETLLSESIPKSHTSQFSGKVRTLLYAIRRQNGVWHDQLAGQGGGCVPRHCGQLGTSGHFPSQSIQSLIHEPRDRPIPGEKVQ